MKEGDVLFGSVIVFFDDKTPARVVVCSSKNFEGTVGWGWGKGMKEGDVLFGSVIVFFDDKTPAGVVVCSSKSMSPVAENLIMTLSGLYGEKMEKPTKQHMMIIKVTFKRDNFGQVPYFSVVPGERELTTGGYLERFLDKMCTYCRQDKETYPFVPAIRACEERLLSR
ncbi:hypothetical protein CEXT_64641 [Caerostris extrusa]|uniref:Uncharacterized protein n=1 Tax=Caerostris extrusa TaxID=172846 RepID=A0AAV4MLG2_CAEEX|nr:hypothetical protein CEXT_64641 [Caerostris extrusa]